MPSILTYKQNKLRHGDALIARVRGMALKKLAKKMTAIYNYIATEEHPYWSGAYMSSWKIGYGEIDYKYNEPPPRSKDGPSHTYADLMPTKWEDVYARMYNMKNDGTALAFITNSVPYVRIIESVGTPLHYKGNPQPWHILQHAITSAPTMASYMNAMSPSGLGA